MAYFYIILIYTYSINPIDTTNCGVNMQISNKICAYPDCSNIANYYTWSDDYICNDCKERELRENEYDTTEEDYTLC